MASPCHPATGWLPPQWTSLYSGPVVRRDNRREQKLPWALHACTLCNRSHTTHPVANEISCLCPEEIPQVSAREVSAATSEFLAHGPTDLKLFPCNKFHPSSTVPKPIGPFSQALKIGLRFAYVSPTFRLQTRVFPISYVVQ